MQGTFRMKRIESLDYFRGLMALSVMFYHYTSWYSGGVEVDNLLGKLGVYAVAAFYILSGLSLALVYKNKITTKGAVFGFLIKRIFRIFPLFWLAILAGIGIKIAIYVIKGTPIDVTAYQLFLNITLLFGFVSPSSYITTGAWSIGNEVVFYSILPIVFLLSYKTDKPLIITFVISLVLGSLFAFLLLSNEITLAEQWTLYVNPLNQVFLFMSGVLLGWYAEHIKKIVPKNLSLFVLLLSIMVFVFYPVAGNQSSIVTGKERFIFSFLMLVIVSMIFICDFKLDGLMNNILLFLGQGCYSIYLLHPIFASPVVFLFDVLGFQLLYAYIMAGFLTLIASYYTFRFIENPMMNQGKTLCDKFIKNRKTNITSTNEAKN